MDTNYDLREINLYLVIILAILIGTFLLQLIVDTLNIRHLKTDLPQEFKGLYDEEKYRISQTYLKECTRFGIISESITLVLTIGFILVGGFNMADRAARGFNLGPIWTGLVFAGIIILASQILHIPFSIYDTFVIEEKYGFNKTTPKTFILDILKSWVMLLIIGGPALALTLWFFQEAGRWAWVYCWAALTMLQMFLIFIAPVVIMPLFNKFVPLEEGELKKAIEDYANEQMFKIKGVFKMDGSKRSTKSNAFFTGFGRFKRIVLFDTLIEKHSVDELVSVLAHEIGHYKKRHILKSLILSVFTSGIMFYILSFFLNNPGLFEAFKMQETSIYASLLFFGFLYSPIDMVISVFRNAVSRKHEFEADAYVVRTFKRPDTLTLALKKLSVDNLSNLNPHPLKVMLSYSHPPVLDRIRALRQSVKPKMVSP